LCSAPSHTKSLVRFATCFLPAFPSFKPEALSIALLIPIFCINEYIGSIPAEDSMFKFSFAINFNYLIALQHYEELILYFS
jgi:hypothetical protein